MQDLNNVRNFASVMVNLKKTFIDMGSTAGIFAVLSLLVYYLCAPSLCFLEDTATFIGYDRGNAAMRMSSGGCARLMALWLQQWFVTSVGASLIMGGLLTVITLSLGNVLSRLSGQHGLMPLALVPSIILIYVQSDIDYRLAGSVSVAVVSVCLMPVAAVGNAWIRLGISLAGCGIISLAAGPASVLFAAGAVIIALARDGRKGLYTLLCLPLVYGISYLEYIRGEWASPEMAMLPWGYYSHWHHSAFADLLPWIAVILIITVAAILRKAIALPAIKPTKPWLFPVLSGITAAFMAGWTIHATDYPRTDSFAKMWLHTSANEWDEIVTGYKDVDKEDATMQNFLNLALAEKGILCDQLFWHSNKGVAALHNTEQKNPYNYMLLSRVYYSMGFMALAKRYAFEANEALGNSSPQMLMLLADTNIVTGDYAVAAKYLDMLAATSQYSGWAKEKMNLLFNDSAVAADPVLGMKRGCLFPDNRFAGIHGIADDMQQVLRANPHHTSTMQYLGAYLMLSRNIPGLISMIDEFHDTQALRVPLPVHFQEAVVIDGLVSGSGIDARYNIHPSVLERCRAFWAEHKPQPNTLWHYLRQK